MEFHERHLKVFRSSAAGRWPAAKIPGRWFDSIGYATKSRLPESIAGRPPDRKVFQVPLRKRFNKLLLRKHQQSDGRVHRLCDFKILLRRRLTALFDDS
jgi:hypothetical protein